MLIRADNHLQTKRWEEEENEKEEERLVLCDISSAYE